MARRHSGLLSLLLAAAAAGFWMGARAAPPLRITEFGGTADGLMLGWQQAGAGVAYTVQFQDTLQDGIWRIPAAFAPFPLDSTQWLDAWSTTNTSRFYRVVAVPATQRGKVISATFNSRLTASSLSFLFALGGIPITPQYNVALYKVVYETITPLGARTIASGALVLPENAPGPLPLVSYQHGTLTQTNSAPSSMDLTGEVTIGVAFASTGYAAAVPDYLGLGDSPGLHPYHHARSEATACVDMLRAARTVCATNGITLKDRLFLCGYSEGGHATMALLRELETFHAGEFTVTACAPMAGAYDLSGVTTDDFLTNRFAPNPYYFLYLLAAYQEVYQLAPSLAGLLAAPYDTKLPPALGGNYSGDQINALMPTNNIVQILKPECLAAFRANPRHPLRLALQDNDLYRWTPRAPMQLYQCSGDQDVDPANAQVALASFHSLGATQVQLIDPQLGATHSGCVLPSLKDAKLWFDSLR